LTTPHAEPPIEDRRMARFLRRELWFVVAAVVAIAAAWLFAQRHATLAPAPGAPLGGLTSNTTTSSSAGAGAPAAARPPG
jgi:hypothetical protein